MKGRSWGLWLLTIAVATFLISLGLWQLSRAEEKQSILLQQQSQDQEAALKGMPMSIDAEVLRHRRVELRGQFHSERQFLLDNQISQGQVGYNVLTPMKLSDGRWVLVDRGWIVQGVSRSALPNIEVSEELSVVQGRIYAPYAEAYALGEFNSGAVGWPLVIQFLDFHGIEAELDEAILPVTIRMDSESGPGYRREWSVVAMGPQKHLGYAVQWFAMAAAFLTLMWLANRKRTNQ